MSVRTRAQAAGEGSVLLQYPPYPARVYVDQKRVDTNGSLRNNTVTMSAGRHTLQIEAQVNGQVQAMRCPVDLHPNERQTLKVTLRRVELPRWDNYARQFTRTNVGAPGPAGEPGAPAVPYRPLPANLSVLQLREIAHQGVDILLDDLQARIDTARNQVFSYEKPVYVYAPQKYSPEPAGPQGAIGLVGRAGIAPEIALIQTPDGKRLLDYVQQQGRWDELQTRLAALEKRLSVLTTAPNPVPASAPTIQILTPEWKAPLDRALQSMQAVPPMPGFLPELLAPSGPTGPPGPRGMDGVPPADAKPLRLSRETLTELLTVLFQIESDSSRTSQMWTSLQDLEQRVALAEHDHQELSLKPKP